MRDLGEALASPKQLQHFENLNNAILLHDEQLRQFCVCLRRIDSPQLNDFEGRDDSRDWLEYKMVKLMQAADHARRVLDLVEETAEVSAKDKRKYVLLVNTELKPINRGLDALHRTLVVTGSGN